MSSPPRSSGEEPLIKKTRRKKKKPSPELPQTPQQSTHISSLPDDLLWSCLARISRCHYPSLSLVSRRFRSLLASPNLYETRSFSGCTESCLYVCLRVPPDAKPRWFTLCQKPSRMKKNKSKGNLLVPIPNLTSPEAHWAGVVALGSSIYVIGGPLNDSPSSDVWVLDCPSHVWRKAPSMRVERDYPEANVFDGKIYVAGGCKGKDSNWMEVFDPKTQTWEPVLCPLADICSTDLSTSAVIEGRIFYMFGQFGKDGGLAYRPMEDRWEETVGKSSLDLERAWFSCCVVDNVLCCYRASDKLKWYWYNFKGQQWMNLKGFKGLPKFAGDYWVNLADYGGKLAVFWTKYLRSSEYEKMTIWCAVIVLERRNNGDEIWGTVEQLGPVLKVPDSFTFVCAHAATA